MCLDTPWPAITWEEQEWCGESHPAALPAQIAELCPRPTGEIRDFAQEAELSLARLDGRYGHGNRGLRGLMTICEALASSHLEGPSGPILDSLIAMTHGGIDSAAAEAAANIHALNSVLSTSGPPSIDVTRTAHRVLFQALPEHSPGEFRASPIWIKGEMHSPIRIQKHAPHSSRIKPAIEDLGRFIQRTDIPPLTLIATAHAQFETVHAFSYGNGRVGRAMAQLALRRRGVTLNVVAPISIGLRADIESYYRALVAYRKGNVSPIIAQFATATIRAISAVDKLATELETIRSTGMTRSQFRRNHTGISILEYALREPVLNAGMAANAIGVSVTNVYRVLTQLQSLGLLASTGKQYRVEYWYSPQLLETMTRLITTSARRNTAHQPASITIGN